MSLTDQIDTDFKGALKNKKTEELSVLRMLKSSIKNFEIGEQKTANDDDVIRLIQHEIKQRKDSIESYTSGGRAELADKERSEIKILEKYMPQQLSPEELIKIIEKAISEVGATTPADMGKVMGRVMPQVAGRADGSTVSAKVKELLSR